MKMRLKKLSTVTLTQSIPASLQLMNSILYSDLKLLILTELLTEEHSYEVSRAPTMYDPYYIVICNNNKCRKISKEIFDYFFQNPQEWREEQLEKLLTN